MNKKLYFVILFLIWKILMVLFFYDKISVKPKIYFVMLAMYKP